MTDEILLDCEDRMDKAVVAYEHTLETVRTGRASTALVEHLHVTHYGHAMPLNQLATLAAPDLAIAVRNTLILAVLTTSIAVPTSSCFVLFG